MKRAMARQAPLDLALSAQPEAVPAVRRAVRARLIEWGLGDLVDPVSVVVSELATNAVLHTRGTLRVTLRRENDGARLEVADDSPRLPQQRQRSALSGTGRGLAIVAELAREWGVQATDGGGKVVWAAFSPQDSEAVWQSKDWLADL